jgi:hypothetical protein
MTIGIRILNFTKDLKYNDGDDSLEFVLNTYAPLSSTFNPIARSPG